MPKGQPGSRPESKMPFARTAEKAKRNKRIRKDYFANKPVADLVKKYDLGAAMIYNIAGNPYSEFTKAQYDQL